MIVLVDMKQPRKSNASFVGFTVDPKAFIAGLGMDFNESLRNVSRIGAVDPDLLPTEAERLVLGRKKQLNTELRQHIASKQPQSQGSLQTQSQGSFYLKAIVGTGIVGAVVLCLTSAVSEASKAVSLVAATAALSNLDRLSLFAKRTTDVATPSIGSAHAPSR
jgi:hypothetical protein